MRLRETIAKLIAPGLRSDPEIRELVAEEVKRAKAALPIMVNYDPNNEGYRGISGGQPQRRDMIPWGQDLMFEWAYYMHDQSATVKGLAEMDKSFLFAEPITVACDDKNAQAVVDRFIADDENNMNINFPNDMMWLSLLGEQCWPVDVNKQNGHVRLRYIDPVQIADVWTNPQNVKQVMRIDLKGVMGRPGKKHPAIRTDNNAYSKTYGRLVGEVFFFAINHPPNSPRGRSDYLTLFDHIDGMERFLFNSLEHSEELQAFIWDVLLKNFNDEQIREWLTNNPRPQPGSVRAHNENVEWKAVAPRLQAYERGKTFDMVKAFVLGAKRRPESWFGGGGKAYQTEAEQFGQVPIKDLDQRQLYIKHIYTRVIRFVLDQALIHGRLTEAQADAGFMVNMPEISKKDLTKLINGVPQASTGLKIAEDSNWIRKETAARIFCGIINQLGQEVNVEDEVKAIEEKPPDELRDYLK